MIERSEGRNEKVECGRTSGWEIKKRVRERKKRRGEGESA